MEFNRPIIVEGDQQKTSRPWEFLLWIIIGVVLLIIFMQIHEFGRALLAAGLSLLSIFLLIDIFPKDSHWIDSDIGFIICVALIFLVSWIACAAKYGFLFGFGLGWLPSAILAYLLAFIWRFILLSIVAGCAALAIWVN